MTTTAANTPTTPQATPANESGKATKPRRVKKLSKPDVIVLSIMVGIPTLVELLLVWLPAVGSIGLSFTRWDGISLDGIRSAGWSNYSYVVNDYPQFWPAVWHNVIWLVFLSVIATPLGLLLAILLDQKIKGSRIYQTIFFIPVMLSLSLVGIIWQLMYARENGFINNLLGIADGPHAVDWIGDTHVNLWAALVAATWKHAGYIMILYLAGLKGVDPSLREAAAIDGATATQTFFRVVFPAMRPINIVVVVVTIIEALRAFDLVYVLNGGRNGLELLSVLVIQNLKGEGLDIGVGSAIAVILLVISLVPITAYLTRVFGKEKVA